MPRKFYSLVLLALLLPSCGSLSRYLEYRGMDFLDCVKANVGAGLGFAIDLKATEYFAPGLGYMSFTGNFGWDDRYVNGVWQEAVVVNTPRAVWEVVGSDEEERATSDVRPENRLVRLSLASLLLANERWIRMRKMDRVDVQYFSLLNFSAVPSFLRVADPSRIFLLEGEVPRQRNKSFWQKGWLEVGATVLFFHARTGVNPFEMIDFVAGIFGLDPAGDDRVVLSQHPASQPSTKKAGTRTAQLQKD